MSYYEDGEGILDEIAEEHFRNAWCPKCETHAEDCVGHDEDFSPKDGGVHNPGSECVLIPAEPGSPISDGKLRAPVKGNIDWPNYEPMQDDIGGNVILDRVQANEDWHGGAESNAYTASEAEARRKDWQDE